MTVLHRSLTPDDRRRHVRAWFHCTGAGRDRHPLHWSGPIVAFYRDVIGLKSTTKRSDGRIVFFQLAEGFGGHTSVLALFRYDMEAAGGTPAGEQPPATGPASSLHHLALSLP